MSAPIRVQIEADEAMQDQFEVMPSLAENELGDETPIAVPVVAGEPTPADTDVTMETPPIMFPDELSSKNSEVDTGTAQENEHASAVPLVARTLKNPPEIWDLVHETPVQFNPGGAFVARLTSSRTKLVLLTLAVVGIAGLGAYAIMTLRDGRNRGGSSAQVQEASGTSPTVSPSQAIVPTTQSAQNAPVNVQSDTQANNSGAGNNVANTPTRPAETQATDLQATGPQPDSAASADSSLANNIQPTGVSVSNVSKRTPSVRPAAEWGNKNATVVAGRQRADESRSARGESGTAAGPDTSARRQTSEALQAADLKRGNEKNSIDSASAKKRSDTTASPQVSAPPPATSTVPKAKVIQWP
ncbi:MAG: hypothetical protein M3R69_03845 [Acidobacteriota bacterium]|nr:hypothetical protein [Acidobacteriota bacterium]